MTPTEATASCKRRVLFITQWFEPEPAFKGAYFARELSLAGHEVRVVTGFPNYPGGKVYDGYRIRWRSHEMIAGVPVDRLALWPSHDQSTIGRVANYLSFFVTTLIYCLRNMRKFDVAYVYHPPITPGLAAAIAGKVSGTPFVLDVQDLWPDSVAASGMGNRCIVRVLNALCGYVYQRAALVIGQSAGITELLAGRGVSRDKLRHIYNWSNYHPSNDPTRVDQAAIPEWVERSFEGHFNIVYGGNLGQAQALDCLIQAAVIARRSNPTIRLHLIGGGIVQDELTQLAAYSGGAAILHGKLPRDVTDRIFECADVLTLHLKDEALFQHTIPSKLQHYLSVGKPILAGIAGEGAKLLEDSGAARTFQPMDMAAASAAMLELAAQSKTTLEKMQQSAKRYYSDHLSFQTAIVKTLEAIDEAALKVA